MYQATGLPAVKTNEPRGGRRDRKPPSREGAVVPRTLQRALACEWTSRGEGDSHTRPERRGQEMVHSIYMNTQNRHILSTRYKHTNYYCGHVPLYVHVPVHPCILHSVHNQVHRALFKKEGEGKERERTTTSTA